MSEAKFTPGIELIAAERERQISQEGWTPEHDDEHDSGELIAAAIAYANYASPFDLEIRHSAVWPWDEEWWKPTKGDSIRNLAKAGALIAAEIDRLQRAEGK